MSDLISRSELIAKIKPPAEDDYDHKVSVGFVRKMLFNFANSVPAVDAAEVVRCADCVYWQDNNGGYPHEDCRWGKGETPDADDYCSFGERKADGQQTDS